MHSEHNTHKKETTKYKDKRNNETMMSPPARRTSRRIQALKRKRSNDGVEEQLVTNTTSPPSKKRTKTTSASKSRSTPASSSSSPSKTKSKSTPTSSSSSKTQKTTKKKTASTSKSKSTPDSASSLSETKITTKKNKQEDVELSNIFDSDIIISKISSFCDYQTKATTLRSLNKRTKEVVNKELYDAIVKKDKKSSPSVLPFSTKIKKGSFKPKITIKKKRGEWSKGLNSRDELFELMLEKRGDEIKSMYTDVKGGKTVLKTKIDEFKVSNGKVMLSTQRSGEGGNFELKPNAFNADLVHEWAIEFEHYDDHELKRGAIGKTFFTDYIFDTIRQIAPARGPGVYITYDEETMKSYKKILFSILVNAKTITYHRFQFHKFGWPDGTHKIRYKDCLDQNLEFGKALFKGALTVLMPDDKTQFEVTIDHMSSRALRSPESFLWQQRH